MHAVRGERPAVVLAGPQQVDFVAAAGSHLRAPQRAGAQVDLEAVDAAVSVGPDARQLAGDLGERIVDGNASVFVQAVHLAVRHPEILDPLVSALHAEAEEDVPGAVECDAAACRHVGESVVVLGVGLVDRLLVGPGAVLQAPANELDHRHRTGAAIGTAVAEAQVDPAVLRVVRVQRHVEDPAEPVVQGSEPERLPVVHRRAADEVRLRAVGGYDGETAHLLREQDATVRQRRDGGGQGLEAIDHLRQPVPVARGLDDPVGQLERRCHPEVGERCVGAFFGNEDGQAADLSCAEGLRPRGHAEVRRTLGDALRDGLHALAPDQRRAGQRRALGRALEAVSVADGAVLLVQAFRRSNAWERSWPAAVAAARQVSETMQMMASRMDGLPDVMR